MSLINDALKRASEAQVQTTPRPRGPKGVEDRPVPMVPAATRERPAWLPIVAISLLVLALLSASGFFFAKWWKERQAWQPYAETPEDDSATNNAAGPRPAQIAKKTDPVAPAPQKVTSTNPPPPAVTPPTLTPTNPAPAVNVPSPPPVSLPPAPTMTNPAVAVVPAVTGLPPVVAPPAVAPPAVAPPAVAAIVTNPPPIVPAVVTKVEPTPPPVVIPPPASTGKTTDGSTKVAAVDFPDIKLQGIIRAKKKTSAIVNGKTLSLGDRLDGAFLLKIDQESVTFEKGSVRREFYLLR